MRFTVGTAQSCIQDMADVYDWIAASSRVGADSWLEEITAEIETLAVFPRRCSLAPESPRSGIEVRQLLCGDYRILFSIEGQQVRVQRVRHAARLPLASDP